jgi:hypothetical protein
VRRILAAVDRMLERLADLVYGPGEDDETLTTGDRLTAALAALRQVGGDEHCPASVRSIARGSLNPPARSARLTRAGACRGPGAYPREGDALEGGRTAAWPAWIHVRGSRT